MPSMALRLVGESATQWGGPSVPSMALRLVGESVRQWGRTI